MSSDSNSNEDEPTSSIKKTPLNSDGAKFTIPREELMKQLRNFKLSTYGSDLILSKRLQEHKRFIRTKYKWPQQYDYLLVIDFEATCVENDLDEDKNSYPHEIIEFPIVLYDMRNHCIKDVFHSYVRPVRNTQLSDFCTNLTKIQQSTIDSSPEFTAVLQKAEQWIFQQHKLKMFQFAVVCDCNSDMAQFMRIQCNITDIPIPKWCQYWINLKKTFRNFYKIPFKQKVNLKVMLEHLGLTFEGQCHSGLDDAKNITQVVDTLLKDNCSLLINQQLCYKSERYFRTVPFKEAEFLRFRNSGDRRSRYKLTNNNAESAASSSRQRVSNKTPVGEEDESVLEETKNLTVKSKSSEFYFILLLIIVLIIITGFYAWKALISRSY